MQLNAQTMDDSLNLQTIKEKGIDAYIATVKRKKHKKMLLKFTKERDSLTKMRIHKETSTFYEIWVDHRSIEGYSWGEGYKLSKNDGSIEMIWHEHPIKSSALELEINPEK